MAYDKADVQLLASFLGDATGAGVLGSSKTTKVWSKSKAMTNMSGAMVYARQLSITWGSDPRYWRWLWLEDMSVEVAELLDVCWLDVSGDYELQHLNPGKYDVFFVILLKNPSGFEPKVTLKLVDPDGNKQQKKVLLTQVQEKKWVTLKVGEFQVRDSDAKGDREIKFSMTSTEDMNWKKGLIVQGVLIRPIERVDDDDDDLSPKLPRKPIPGSYGTPILSPIKDRLDYYYFQGEERFFQSRLDKYGSTVFRVNMPPGPFMASNPNVVVVLDAKSFRVLFDNSKVEKKNVFTGTYMPSTSLTGGFRVCSYLDPSEPTHAKVKQLLFDLLASRKAHFIPSFGTAYSALFDGMESELAASAMATADFNKLNDGTALEFLGEAYFGVPPSASPALGTTGPSKATKWLFFQLCPLMTLGLPKILEEIFLHTFPLPTFLVKSDYKALYAYFSNAASPVLDRAEKLSGLSREEACHNLLFATCFNSYGGMKVMFPEILKWLAQAGPELHDRLAEEVRAAVKAEGGRVTLAAVERMELVRSVVYEVLRIEPPVKFQYGKAMRDLVIESHDASFEVKKGEMIFGYQPFATRDERVFANGGDFVGDRFVGEKGRKLLEYVVWSNGPETESPTVGNKQCAGKDFVVLMGRLLVVEFFLRYDTFTADIKKQLLGSQVIVTSLTKAGGAN